MKWNWQLPNWPSFTFNPREISELEKRFLLEAGESMAFLKTVESKDQKRFIVEILTAEGMESSKIEGEILNRESLQSSINRHFGLKSLSKKVSPKEAGMAMLLCDVYDTFSAPLTHEMLYKWHAMLFQESTEISDCGRYRSHKEPMQIVSHRYDQPQVFFEAPPSKQVFSEMEAFVEWFNKANDTGSIFVRAAIAHLYFESIHPFEDGNGRIGRALVEKILSQEIGRPVLVSVSTTLEKDRKSYYSELGKCNHCLDVQEWVYFFSLSLLKAQRESLALLYFLVEKAKMFQQFSGLLNTRQEKLLLRMFAEGPKGFKGGLSAENYTRITKASRATATRDLADLVRLGALKKTGELRHTRYWLNIQQRKIKNVDKI